MMDETVSPSSPAGSPMDLNRPEGAPIKRIRSQGAVEEFKRTQSSKELVRFIQSCNAAVRGVKRSASTTPADLSQFPIVKKVCDMFEMLRQWVADIPLHDMKAQRFGNKAFRDLHMKLDEFGPNEIVGGLLKDAKGEHPTSPRSRAELFGYLKDSFGNSTRIDYGTGHELHFFIFLRILITMHGLMELGEEEMTALLRGLVLHCFWEYIDFMRLLQRHYQLEPAGSHGVWGLDDYHHLPYIFGAAQLCGAELDPTTPVLPKHITDATVVKKQSEEYFYFVMIDWIMENKKGPFHEHSSVLFNVSGIDEWPRIEAGMVKMFDGEVLSKFNIVQHLLFGDHFAFE